MTIESPRRLLRNIQAEFERVQFSGSNESGVRPIGTSVIVLMDCVATTTSGAAGAAMLAESGIAPAAGAGSLGITLEPGMIEKMNSASESGVIVAIGDAAFRYYDDGSKWTDYRPAVGDRVFVERYSGRELMGRDGRTYRMMTYTCIGGLEEAAQHIAAEDETVGENASLGVPKRFSLEKD